jgi:predicted Zn-dependent protease
MGMTEKFESMLASGQDSPLLRFSLGNAYLQAGEPDRAVEHLRRAVDQDSDYSAAWKALGKALLESGRPAEAIPTLERGIAVAESRGDIQAAKEMRVFRKRAEKRAAESG